MEIIIGIPTFNRPESLVRRLKEIEQFSSKISGVVICDNSDEKNIVAERMCLSKINWHYFKNEINIGGGANFLRVVELAPKGTHLWWRGDDDPITLAQFNAVINSNIDTNTLLLLKPEDTPVFKGKGIYEFSRNFSEINPFGWLSMVILPLELAKKSLMYGYWGIYTGWANVTLILGLFKVDSEMKFMVAPFKMESGDFRDIGQADGQWWALFNTCIKNFALTANMISDPKTRRIYLKYWRKTQRYSLPKNMIRGRLGLGKQEIINYETLKPLLSFDNPDKTPLFFILLILANTPRFFPRILVAFWSGNQPENKLKKMGLSFLINAKSLNERYRLLKTNMNKEVAGTFL
jgi:hypothetical protein